MILNAQAFQGLSKTTLLRPCWLGLPWVVAQVCHNLPLWSVRHCILLEWCESLCGSCPCSPGTLLFIVLAKRESETIVRAFLYLTFWQPLINIRTFLFACLEKELFSSMLLKCSPFRLTEVQLFAVTKPKFWNPLGRSHRRTSATQGLSACKILQLRRPCSKFHCIELHLKCNLEQHYV